MPSFRNLFRRKPAPASSTAAERKNDCARQLVDRGIACEESGDLDRAMQFYREAIAANPDHAAGHYNLALGCLQIGAHAEAEASFRSALIAQARFPEAWVGLADALEALGRDTDALAALGKAIGQREQYVGALFNSSLLLSKMGRHREAAARLLEIDLEALFLAGRHPEAEALSRKACELNPEYGTGWKILGAVAALEQKYSEAAVSLGHAAALLPADAETHHNLAICLQALARLAEAEASYRRALELKPGYHEAHNNLANVLHAQGKSIEAETHCRRALELRPDFYAAHSDLGNILDAMGRPSEALLCYRQALLLNPQNHLAHSNLAACLMTLGRVHEAETSCLRALELRPDYLEGHNNLLFLLNYHPDKTPKEIYCAYQEFEARVGLALRTDWRPHKNDRDPERRVRIGYVSPDFRRHPAQHFVEPLLDHHDKSAVEVFIYAEVALEDQVSARMKCKVDRWISTCGMTDQELADAIRKDRIDVLVDLAGHTRGNRLAVFARKPAPVSVTAIGFGHTTGLSAIDWFLTDAVVVPDGAEGVFSEGVWRLPLCQVYRPAENMGPVGDLPASKRGHVTFGSLSRAARINHRVVRAWSAILQSVPHSRLRINSLNFRDAELCETVAAQFAAHGIERQRLDLGFSSPPWDEMRDIDITLDCFPQNSGTTLFESLYMGIPFITMADRPALGRLGASIASHVGHPEWIANSEAEYVEKAVSLANRPIYLSAIRSRLRDDMTESSLMNERGYVQDVEGAYRAMWRAWCASQGG